MKHKFNHLDVGDLIFIMEYPNYKALRQHGYTRQELEPIFAVIGGLMPNYHYNFYEHENTVYVEMLK